MKIRNKFFQKSGNFEPLRFHVFSVPHNPSHPDFSCCAYAKKALNLCWMLKSLGHTVFHYGNELSDVVCDEHISVTTEEELYECYPNCLKNRGYIDQHPNGSLYLYELYNLRTNHEASKRYQEGDFFCYVTPTCQVKLYNSLLDLPVHHIESGVGYYKAYMQYRVFESPGIRDLHYGYYFNNSEQYWNLSEEEQKQAVYNPNTPVDLGHVPTHDAVIPNSADITEFNFKTKKDDYFLYLGRVIEPKGVLTAMNICDALGKKLIVAGPGDFEKNLKVKPSKNVEIFKSSDGSSIANVKERKELLANALGLFCISDCFECLGNTAIEAMLSGTPPISSDVGGFTYTIRSGYNGYRLGLNRVEQGIWAAKNVDKIDPYNLRDFGLRFSNEQTALRYHEYFTSLNNKIKNEAEDYELLNPDRNNLDWLDYDRKIDWNESWMTPVDK